MNVGWNPMCLRKSNIFSHKLDVQEANVSSTARWNQKSFPWMLVCEWTGSVTFLVEHRHTTQQEVVTSVRNSNTKLKRRGNQDVDDLSNVHHVITIASSSQCAAQLSFLMK